MPRTYKVETCGSGPIALQKLVTAIGNDGGRVISVILMDPDPLFVVISEYDTDA